MYVYNNRYVLFTCSGSLTDVHHSQKNLKEAAPLIVVQIEMAKVLIYTWMHDV